MESNLEKTMSVKEENTNNSSMPLNELQFVPEVISTIEKILKTNDPMDTPDFNTIDYINQLFPHEQSLASIDETIHRMQCDISLIDDNIRSVVRGQSNTGEDGKAALYEAQKIIGTLYTQIIDVKSRAEHTEEMVKEITREIKALDFAKRNLTTAITTLNHLHMLVGGISTLNNLTDNRLYGEIVNPLQAITEVNQHFKQYSNIEEIKKLSDSVVKIQLKLAQQIIKDFKNSFIGKGPSTSDNPRLTLKQLTEACEVLSILDPKDKKELIKWFIGLQLEEYVQLFHENQDIAWLDKIDNRYSWFKRHLLDFEEKFGNLFPHDWEMSERITIEFCRMTQEQLKQIMTKRSAEIDVRLLLFAINKTQSFEQLLSKRFSGECLDISLPDVPQNTQAAVKPTVAAFNDRIGSCFKAHLSIYIKSIDHNLSELMEKFVELSKEEVKMIDNKSSVYSSAADLFVFYKKCIIQCNQLSNEQPMYELSLIFKKYLREYASNVLELNVPKLLGNTASISKPMSLLTRDMQTLSSAAGQVFHNLLKEGDIQRFSRDDLIRLCCVLTTAEYCLETVEQLEGKLKEKVATSFASKIDMSEEMDVFHRIISNCINLLVQDMEAGCEAPLQAMAKIQWQNISNVGDESSFITSICGNFKQMVPLLRDHLSTSRKYFTQFCLRFVTTFIPKFINVLYKCKLMIPDVSNNVLGCEQLLLDTHSLKTALLNLPSIGSNVHRKAPTSYTKVVVKDMTRAEMIIKVVMSSIYPQSHFTQQVLQLLPDITIAEYQKILDMKSVKRVDQLQLIDQLKRTASTTPASLSTEADTEGGGGLQINGTDVTENITSTGSSSSNALRSQDDIPTINSLTTPKRSFIFSVSSYTGAAASDRDKTEDNSSSNSDRGRIRKLENLLKKRLP